MLTIPAAIEHIYTRNQGKQQAYQMVVQLLGMDLMCWLSSTRGFDWGTARRVISSKGGVDDEMMTPGLVVQHHAGVSPYFDAGENDVIAWSQLGEVIRATNIGRAWYRGSMVGVRCQPFFHVEFDLWGLEKMYLLHWCHLGVLPVMLILSMCP
ncbi:hypothetical protein BO94DRAFT_532209 [Aspergillus sclerotioniger CBS 115572]|uniref:Uncharacterized protein n=1 Tax=Aspergillus sclerotioniger CBS 115572 TaxID=1450535 RepID=A0A317XCJ6_9EURO|nr:hypothetical protein BO94DRAFT_532209 [Aspergillus sclerotioniger CBS 115572]PWY94270.1 hypothetical protein BO94DRAFT_532209 [Aspergillus sclerotioniger CBS 115572]